MMLRLFLLNCLLACTLLGFGQDGFPFMSQFELARQYSDSRIGSMVQDNEENMYFATTRGLLKYDGYRWTRIACPSPVLEVFHDAGSDRLFVGMKKGAAEVLFSDSGTYVVQPIDGIPASQHISYILSTGTDVYFVAENQIHQLTLNGQAPVSTFTFAEMLITGAFVHRQQLHLLFFKDGLFRWDHEELKALGKFEQMNKDQILCSFIVGDETYIGLDSDMLFRFDGKRIRPVNTALQQFLSDNLLSDGVKLNDSLLAVSTLAGGVLVVESRSHKIRYHFNYATGLRDNEVFCLGTDRDHGLWMALDGGLARADLYQPVRELSVYPGLEGSITTTLVANGKLHVGTGNGVFVLQKASSQEEVNQVLLAIREREEIKADDDKRDASETQQETGSDAQDEPLFTSERELLMERYKADPEGVKKELTRKELRELKRDIRIQRRAERGNALVGEKVKNFFSGNGIDEDPEKDDAVEEAPGTVATEQNNNETTPTSLPASKPASKKVEQQAYLFKKIQGIDVKCRQLLQLGNAIFAATNNGVCLIRNGKAENLSPGLYINHINVRKNRSALLMATGDGVYELVQGMNGRWTLSVLNDTLQYVAYNVIEDAANNIWAGTDNGAYRYFLDEVRYYPIPDAVNERILVANAYGQVHFLLPSSLYHYVAASDTVMEASLPEIPTSDRLEYFTDNDDRVWIHSSYSWYVLNGDQFSPMLSYLELFDDIRSVTADQAGDLYVVDGGRRLYRVHNRKEQVSKVFNVYIHQVTDGNGTPFSLGETKLVANGSSLIFIVSAPFYLKNNGTEYQYRVEGMRNSWSRWSPDPEIDLGNVPPGDYVLQVRARNILGQISEVKNIPFSVPWPLYLRWYFIVLYVMAVVGLVWAIIKYRERSLKETQRILELKVAQRTEELAKAKEQAEKLLLNILPKETAEELKTSGHATARHYDNVSVMFTDFKGFTEYAENTSPEELVNELHRYFARFDAIVDRYRIEKIKTIGDAYMCASGVPVSNNNSAIITTLAALEIRDFMAQENESKQLSGLVPLQIRIGIHTGPLTAGVVGIRKFAYDIWGDTVNLASRMETASLPGKINVSATTHESIRKFFDTEPRGERSVKGKGKVEMFFVHSIKSEFSVNGEGKEPNDRLLSLIGLEHTTQH